MEISLNQEKSVSNEADNCDVVHDAQNLITVIENCNREIKNLKRSKDRAEYLLVKLVANEKQEGVKTAHFGDYVVKVTNKVARALDLEKYLEIADSLPVNPVKVKYQLDVKNLRHLLAVDPELVAMFVTEKPGKPSLSIKG